MPVRVNTNIFEEAKHIVADPLDYPKFGRLHQKMKALEKSNADGTLPPGSYKEFVKTRPMVMFDVALTQVADRTGANLGTEAGYNSVIGQKAVLNTELDRVRAELTEGWIQDGDTSYKKFSAATPQAVLDRFSAALSSMVDYLVPPDERGDQLTTTTDGQQNHYFHISNALLQRVQQRIGKKV